MQRQAIENRRTPNATRTTLALRRVTGAASACLAVTLCASAAEAAPGESSFTPTSFLMPIRSILLAKARVGTGFDNGASLYDCIPGQAPAAAGDAGAAADASAPADCLVDMASPTALAALFNDTADIAPGTYDSIVVMQCQDEGSFVAQVKGSVELEGQTYYTTSDANVISTVPGDLDYASITYGGCANTVKISPPVTVAAGDSITVNAFFTLQNLSWVLGNNSPGLGGCAVAPPGVNNVCSGLPVLVSFLGNAAPTLDSFYITEDTSDLLAAKAAGQVMLLSAGGEPFAGFLRRVYSHDSVTPSVSYDVPLREITRNLANAADAGADSGAVPDSGAASTRPSYDVYSIGDPAQDTSKYRVRFPHFELETHNGTFFTANGAATLPYRAVKR